ncbi:MAG: hypothetical protein IJ660_07680 [Alphaproteobacteria bacterium]|nr:hypothetical protein [Alphaproteobacteria bacterium]
MDETFDTFDFLINDEDEVMLLLYERDTEPVSVPHIEFDIENKSALLYRNEEDILELGDIEENVLDSLQDADKLLICELSRETDKDGDNTIVRAYEADIDL